jgi:ribosomal protein S27AE
MKNGICPKCANTEVYFKAGHHSQREMITLKPGVLAYGVAPDRYLCASCGYVEQYLAAEKDLQTVREAWDRVLPS